MKNFVCIFNIILIISYEIIFNFNKYTINQHTNLKYISLAIISFTICDLIAYYIHYYFHNNKILYKYIHKIHHIDKFPNFLTTVYMHPIEISLFFFTYRLPLLIGVPFNKTTFLTYQTILILWTFLDHSYNKNIFSDHFKHHKYLTGNYSTCFQFWDYFFKTKI